MQAEYVTAPPLQVSRWFNTAQPITLEHLRGQVVLLHTFQMLCPGCVSHGLPQAAKVHELFAPHGVAVIGIHTVFEHHAVMNAAALEVFIHEYRIKFPIGVDQAHASHSVPLTMQAYELRGTPSVVLLDRRGRLRLSHLGSIDDMALGHAIGQLLAEAPVDQLPDADAAPFDPHSAAAADCTDQGCVLR